MNEELHTYTDGGARGNPGPAAIGVVIQQESIVNGQMSNVILWEHGEYIGTATNNQAEYRALIRALEKAKELGTTNVQCFLDSELLVRQLNGQYRVKDADLGKLFVRAWNLRQGFRMVSFHHIPRSRNRHADRLVNQSLDKFEKKWQS